ncbi:TIGR02444 family protein, partial [Pseudomonas sp. TNT11]
MCADLWSFALSTYARPGVEAACLRLQEQGADVCLLLCGAFGAGQEAVIGKPAGRGAGT